MAWTYGNKPAGSYTYSAEAESVAEWGDAQFFWGDTYLTWGQLDHYARPTKPTGVISYEPKP